jgi:hypothetical protein
MCLQEFNSSLVFIEALRWARPSQLENYAKGQINRSDVLDLLDIQVVDHWNQCAGTIKERGVNIEFPSYQRENAEPCTRFQNLPKKSE